MTTVMSSPLAGRGDDDLLRAGGEVALGLLGLGEQAGRFDHVVDAELLPRQRRPAPSLTARHLISWPLTTSTSSSALSAPDFFELTVAVELALRRVVLQQVGEVVGGDEVVDGDDVELLAEQPLLDQGAEDQPADAAEPVDSDASAHFILPFLLSVIRALWTLALDMTRRRPAKPVSALERVTRPETIGAGQPA